MIFLRELDIPVAIMTGENTQIVQKRADKLKIDYCYLGVKDKVEQAEELCRELGISLSEVAFIGDDLNDLPLLRLVGYSASPSNTPEYVKREVKYVTAAYGGYGAFREFVEKLLSDNGVLEKTLGNSCNVLFAYGWVVFAGRVRYAVTVSLWKRRLFPVLSCL